MKAPNKRVLLVAGVAVIAAGWWLSASPLSPVGPNKPKERPVLRFLVKVAKIGLWVMFVAEQPPKEDAGQVQVVHARVDENGHRVLDHRQGW